MFLNCHRNGSEMSCSVGVKHVYHHFKHGSNQLLMERSHLWGRIVVTLINGNIKLHNKALKLKKTVK